MTANSLNTFSQTAEMRQTNKQLVYSVLKTEPNQSRFEVGRKAGISDIEAQRRLSDLMNEEKAVITGSRKHFKCDVSLYSVPAQLTLFDEKRLSLRAWMKIEYPEALKIYDELYRRK